MSKYGHCENCGCVMEVVGCSNCNELEVIEYFAEPVEVLKGDKK